MEGASKIGTSFEIILPLNIAIKVYVITGIENSVDQMDHATLVTGRTSTVRFGPNDRTFFGRTQNFFFIPHAMPIYFCFA